MNTELIELGSVIKSHGIKGDLVIYITTDDLKHFNGLKSVLLEKDASTVEMQVTSLRFKDKQAVLHLKGIEDRNTSDLYIKKKIYTKPEALPQLDNDFYFHEIIGYTLNDKTLGDLGEVKDVFEMPQHAVISIIYKEKEVLIPASPDFILNIDRQNKILKMDLPDGLLDVYL